MLLKKKFWIQSFLCEELCPLVSLRPVGSSLYWTGCGAYWRARSHYCWTRGLLPAVFPIDGRDPTTAEHGLPAVFPIDGRDPTTAEHGDFCLLCFHPVPIRPSLDNLVTSGSPNVPILMSSLVRTPAPHRSPESRTPARKPSSNSGLQVAGLQEHATTPGRQKIVNDTLI